MGADLKFIHCSDLHLDTPFKNISKYDASIAEEFMASPFLALDAIVDKAVKENVDFVIFSGDIFDTEYSTPRSRYLFADAIRRIGARCYIAYGNHDHVRRWEDTIPLPDNAVVFPDHPVNIPYPNEDDKIADVIGVSHSRREQDNDLTEGIVGTFDFSIAVVHCDLDTASEGKRYAPAKLTHLMNRNIDYWALGHIHKRNVVHKFPHVVYPGNTQGRSPKETGEKGAYLVTVSNGIISNMEFFRTGPILWEDVECDITGKTMDTLIDEISSSLVRGSMLKLRVKGRGDLDRIIRLEQDSFKDLLERRSGCIVATVDMDSGLAIDLDERRRIGDFTSALIASGDSYMGMSRESLIAEICNTRASSDIAHIFQAMSDDELYSIVRDARMSLLERLTEARQ